MINFFFALDWALKHDFDYYDMGSCLARPKDGSLQWKKRWGGLFDTVCNHSYLYVRLPKVGAAQFLRNSPLFAVERNKLALHLGLPDGPSDEEFSIRYRRNGDWRIIQNICAPHQAVQRAPSRKSAQPLQTSAVAPLCGIYFIPLTRIVH